MRHFVGCSNVHKSEKLQHQLIVNRTFRRAAERLRIESVRRKAKLRHVIESTLSVQLSYGKMTPVKIIIKTKIHMTNRSDITSG